MEIEQIKTKAVAYAAGELTRAMRERAKRSFIAGARWRIDAVWHDRIEIPQSHKPILVLNDDDRLSINMIPGVIKSLPAAWIRWAYIEDLLPEGKEATR